MTRHAWVVVAATVFCAVTIGCQQQTRRPDLPAYNIWGQNSPPAQGSTVTDNSQKPPPPRDATGEAAWSDVTGLRQWKYIVIHHSDTAWGNAAEFDREHRARGWDGLGYHFVIDNGAGGPDGRVEVGERWRLQKWGAHTGNTPGNEYNNHGIGVCLVGDFTHHMPTPSQMDSLRRLLRFLMAKYDIPAQNVIGHRDAPGTSTECPGNMFHAYLPTLRAELGR